MAGALPPEGVYDLPGILFSFRCARPPDFLFVFGRVF
jgi:hypothetical protein